jgi:hypothetical protein
MQNQTTYPFTFGNIEFSSFNYEPYSVKGVGKNRHPIINMDKFIDHSMDHELHLECCKGLAKCHNVSPGGMFYGEVPPFEEERFGVNSWDNLLRHLETIDPTGEHRKNLEELMSGPGNDDYKKSCAWRYAYYALGAIVPWFFVVYLRFGNFFTKADSSKSMNTPNAVYFPKLMKYIETLPFKSIGRILFFTTYPNAPICTHRDSIIAEHKDHNINLFFTGGDRSSFIWDSVNNDKIYLEKGARSYFFNNRDYHGVDAEPKFRYTLRIDGTFTDELCEELGLENGYTWKWDYEQNS